MTTENSKPQTNDRIRREVVKSPIVLDKDLYVNTFQKEGTVTAQLRQIVTTKSYYPNKTVDSNLQNGLFAASDFGFGEQEFVDTNVRMAWILIPEGTTKEEVEAKIAAANLNSATIYRILSNEPILDDNQKYAISAKIRTYDDFANKQVVRYPDNDETRENGTAGKIWLDQKGKVQYRRTFFWLTKKEDMDVRGNGKEYVSPEIQAELAGASSLAGQTIM